MLIDLRRRDGNTDVGEEEGTVAIALRCAVVPVQVVSSLTKSGEAKRQAVVCTVNTVEVFMYDERIKNDMDPPLSGLSMIV